MQLSSFGKAVPPSVQREAKTLMNKIADGKVIIFRGPIKDRGGSTRIKSNQILDANALKEIDWLVEGVESSMPGKAYSGAAK